MAKTPLFILIAALLWGGMSLSAAAERLISTDGALTETIFVLHAEEFLVGVDTTSLFPTAATQLPNIGYKRALSAEGILSLQPTRVLITRDVGPPAVLAQLRQLGVNLVDIPHEPTLDGLRTMIRTVAAEVQRDPQPLLQRLDDDLQRLERVVAQQQTGSRVLFLLHVGGGQRLSAGKNTVADTMIRLVGGVNVTAVAFDGYKPVTAEAVVGGQPEVILMAARDDKAVDEALWQQTDIAMTPAAQTRRRVAMDGRLLLGFGPRTGEALFALHEALRGDESAPAYTP